MTDLMRIASSPLAADANISDEIATAGLGFGALVDRTGSAVAATQLRLDTSSAATATALARTLVNVIAVQERILRDDGTIEEIVPHVRPLPLITFINPVFYQWTSVRLQGMFFARELGASAEQSQSSTQSDQGLFGSGLSMVLGPGAFTAGGSSQSSTFTSETASDVSLGRIRSSALLEPRDDVAIPKPNQAIRGPRIALIQGEIQDENDDGTLVARTMSLLIQYNRRGGAPIPNKPISIETDGVPWAFTGDAITNASGQLEIELRREFVGEEPDTAPATFVVTARVGLVQNSVSVTF
jgi:hypothetical protein